MNPDEYDDLLDKVRAAKEQHIVDMHRAADSALELHKLLRLLDAEDSRIARDVLYPTLPGIPTLSTAGSE